MKGRLLDYDWQRNVATIEFEPDFSDTFDKFNGKELNIEIKTWRPKRSGAANRFLWVLVDKIARATRTTKNDVYREAIREIGGVSDVFRMIDEAVPRFCAQWEAQGLGWQTELVSCEDGCTNVIAYYGSSTFDTEQMTQLIENLMFEAEQLGINTDTPDKQAWWETLLEEYDAKAERSKND